MYENRWTDEDVARTGLTFDGEASYSTPDLRGEDDAYMTCGSCGASTYMGDPTCGSCGMRPA